MMVIRPVERSDVPGADAACQQNGRRPDVASANEATLSVRIERAIKTRQGELPVEQGYVCTGR